MAAKSDSVAFNGGTFVVVSVDDGSDVASMLFSVSIANDFLALLLGESATSKSSSSLSTELCIVFEDESSPSCSVMPSAGVEAAAGGVLSGVCGIDPFAKISGVAVTPVVASNASAAPKPESPRAALNLGGGWSKWLAVAAVASKLWICCCFCCPEPCENSVAALSSGWSVAFDWLELTACPSKRFAAVFWFVSRRGNCENRDAASCGAVVAAVGGRSKRLVVAELVPSVPWVEKRAAALSGTFTFGSLKGPQLLMANTPNGVP